MTVVEAPRTASQPLYPHQEQGIELALERHSLLLAWEMRCGKSRGAIEVCDRQESQSVLVLGPKSVRGVWPDQLAQHAAREWRTWNGDVHGTRGILRNPSVAKRAAALVRAHQDARLLGRPFLAFVNYEASWQSDLSRILEGTAWDVVIVDESHRVKSPSGKASRLAARVAWKTRKRGGTVLCLTGTPMPHGPEDIWAQALILDGGQALGLNFRRFCRRFLAPVVLYTVCPECGKSKGLLEAAGQWFCNLCAWTGGPDEKPQEVYLTKGNTNQPIYEGLLPGATEEFTARLAPLMHQVRAEDAVDLPPMIDEYRTCELSPAARRAYDALEKDSIAILQRDGVEAVIRSANAMVMVTRLAQAANGFGRDEITGGWVSLDDGPPAKATLLEDLLGDLPAGEPVVVFCRFHADLNAVKQVAARTGRRYGELSGRDDGGLSDRATMRDDVDLLGVQPQAGGAGIDLSRASVAVLYSADFRLADHEQARARLRHPDKAHRSVLYVNLLTESTIDRAIHGALRKRADVVRSVLERLANPTKEARP